METIILTSLIDESTNRSVKLTPAFAEPDAERKMPKNHPADLTKIALEGNGIYGSRENPLQNPFMIAPRDNGKGGLVFFENKISRDDFFALTRTLGIEESPKPEYANRYAAYYLESEQPGKDGFLTQLRLIDNFGLRFYYSSISAREHDRYPQQELSKAGAYWAFIEHERQRWGVSFWESPKLDGKFGGDGDYAREELSFGLMVEDDYHGISRIWSRAWLVTK